MLSRSIIAGEISRLLDLAEILNFFSLVITTQKDEYPQPSGLTSERSSIIAKSVNLTFLHVRMQQSLCYALLSFCFMTMTLYCDSQIVLGL